MAEGFKSVVITVFQYSVVVKGMEKKLTDAGYKTTVLTNDFGKIGDLAYTTDVFIVYLPNEIVENCVDRESLTYIRDKVSKAGKPMVLIGEAKFRLDLYKKVSDIDHYIWLDRPVEMDALKTAMEKALSGETEKDDVKRILIIDDDPSYAKMVREWIKSKYRVDIVTAGMQAISFLLKVKEDEQVDLILLDYEMPVVDGPQVLQMLRQEPSTANIPVIFLTGIGTKEAVSRVMSLKPDGYILKTTTRDDLLAYLKNKLH
jgi:CheY-like chemotaxis protein